MESKTYFLYLWQNHLSRVCFGITSDLDRRRNGYEGHAGHDIEWRAIWSGPERLIRELESKIKTDFRDHVWAGHRGYRYEWLAEDISLEQIIGWIEFEVQDIATVSKIG